MSEIKKVFGIDSLYFFFETNENYDDLFLEILDQLEELKGKFEKRDIEFENKDLTISIAKNGNIWTQFPKTLEQCLHFYLNTNFGDYLNTYLDKPKN